MGAVMGKLLYPHLAQSLHRASQRRGLKVEAHLKEEELEAVMNRVPRSCAENPFMKGALNVRTTPCLSPGRFFS